MNIYDSLAKRITFEGQPILSNLPFAVMLWDDANGVKQHLITDDEVGRLDIIAWKEYDDVSLAWFIREYNGIIDPMTELVAGEYLEIPQNVSISNIQAFTYNGNV